MPPAPDRVTARRRGLEAEAAVADALQQDGWQVLARNWRGGGGELDLVVARSERVRFVEVKARTASDRVPVGPRQVQRLHSAAEAWMATQATEWWTEACFLLVLVRPDGQLERVLDPF